MEMTSASIEYQQTGWSLSDIFSAWDGPDMQAAMRALEGHLQRLEGMRSELVPTISPDRFSEVLREIEAIAELRGRIAGYAELWFDQDVRNLKAQAAQGQATEIGADIDNRTLFFEIWWKNLDADAAERLLRSAGDYRHWLERLRAFGPHTLAESEERILNIKNVTAGEALRSLWNAIFSRFTFPVEIEGEQRELTFAEVTALYSHPNARVRTAVYDALYAVLGENGPVLGQIFQNVARDWDSEQVGLRRFPTPMSARNLMNELSDEIVDTVLDVCRANAGLFQRFFRLKARALGMDRLRRQDIYVSVTSEEPDYSFTNGFQLVLETFDDFDPRLPDLVRRVAGQRHLDSEDRSGKSGLAFCVSVSPRLTPWVSSTFHGTPTDVSVLAHELGHALHGMLAEGHNILVHQPTLPVAEVASTFSERLLIDRLLRGDVDPATRRGILYSQVTRMYLSIQRQAFFALWEREAHDLVREGATVDDLRELYLQLLHEQFGDAVDVPDMFGWEWAGVYHFVNVPFYVYAYALAQLLTLGLYRRYEEDGDAFRQRYIDLLAAGGSVAPIELLGRAGIDMRDPQFWQGGFDSIGRLVDELEAMHEDASQNQRH